SFSHSSGLVSHSSYVSRKVWLSKQKIQPGCSSRVAGQRRQDFSSRSEQSLVLLSHLSWDCSGPPIQNSLAQLSGYPSCSKASPSSLRRFSWAFIFTDGTSYLHALTGSAPSLSGSAVCFRPGLSSASTPG